jgi:hypothetical protein
MRTIAAVCTDISSRIVASSLPRRCMSRPSLAMSNVGRDAGDSGFETGERRPDLGQLG